MNTTTQARRTPNQMELKTGMLAEGSISGNLYLVTGTSSQYVKVTVLVPNESQTAVGDTTQLPKENLIPYFGEIKINQTP